MNQPDCWFGVMTLAKQVATDEEGKKIIEAYAEAVRAATNSTGQIALDSALMYPAKGMEGLSEQMLGRLRAKHANLRQLPLASKANPWRPRTLTNDGVTAQLSATLSHLGEESVDLFYLHAPDHQVPIEESLAAINAAQKAGKIKRFGLSNYAAWQVADIYRLCVANGYTPPVAYQGMYNAITRDVERELFPCLRNFNMIFYAYNATAGGLLTGKHKNVDSLPETGRFAVDYYQARFWKKAYFAALEVIRGACEAEGVPMADAAHRWLAHHSKMTAGDVIIIGASKLAHVKANTAAALGKPLPQSVVDAFDKANQLTAANQPCYFR